MSLIHCSECQKEVSSQATNCPHCGNVINQNTQVGVGNIGTQNLKVELELTSKRWKKVILIAWLILIAGVLLLGVFATDQDLKWIGINMICLSVPVWIVGKVGAWYSNR